MRGLYARLQAFLKSRSARERRILGLGTAALALTLVYFFAVSPLRSRVQLREAEVTRLQTELTRAVRLARSIQQLQAAVRDVETRIAGGGKTNLFTLLETMAEQAQIKDRLESIKPKQTSDNPLYPETRVEVSLKGATQSQAVQLLYQIETAPVHLIVRSLRIKSRNDGSNLIDVSLSVSSFERA